MKQIELDIRRKCADEFNFGYDVGFKTRDAYLRLSSNTRAKLELRDEMFLDCCEKKPEALMYILGFITGRSDRYDFD